MSDPIQRDPVSPVHFGRDHYSTLLYLESRCVDASGVPDYRKMRCDPRRHPHWNHMPPGLGGKYPTRLADGSPLDDHDDWDCVEDMVAAGWIQNVGTGFQPVYRFTDEGWKVAGMRRRLLAEERSA